MKKILSLLSLCFLFGCSTSNKIAALKPMPSENVPMVYKTTTSFVDMPMEITLKEIENQLNKSLSGLIYEDNNLEDDKSEMKIWKTGTIKLIEKDGKIQSILPLKIWSRFKYGTDFMGLNDTREIDLNGTITLISDAKLSNWKMNTTSKIEDFEWSESPTILVAGKKVPITYIINPTLSIFKSKVAKKIDDAIEKSSDFKPYVLDVLEKMSTPFVTSEQYETWFKLNPIEVYVTDAVLKKSKIEMELGLKCSMQTMVGQQPKNSFNRETVTFKSVTKMPNKTTASIAAISTYESASRIITKNFQGKEFGSGSRKIVVQKVDLWSKDGKMIIALDMTGSINGTIYLSGIPNYNSVTKEIYFDQMDYVLNTKGILTKTANWLLQGTILKKIQENCRYSIKDNLAEGKKNMLPYLSNYSPMKGVFVNGTMDDFEFEKVELTNNAIIAFITATGKMNVKIDGME
ncbi:DUF4403 family protein [Flavobacterium aquatile]|uniref:DUF4403 family protein n=1 Tax=Flavobacterium aquatile LMG 4008 = ATCC 11947 TaxID=1453498 RepID=A0A095SXB4_9FLAO|nr:DUF4403 family protein [Flavobacterium aquatile]KGD69197.1 hypothetical protein LG45_06075 [Flavobacterium aquatile LMG 4008 = ATCC 11947]OXA65900.1 hypothetical protein B0A61_14805 [Flavobacterium aquatile LMG 4008 = ATCC 11947]